MKKIKLDHRAEKRRDSLEIVNKPFTINNNWNINKQLAYSAAYEDEFQSKTIMFCSECAHKAQILSLPETIK